MDPLLIRADANTQMGTGHVMRCLALAEAWQEGGGNAVFLGRIDAPAIRRRLVSEGFEVRDAKARDGGPDDATATSALASEFGAEWVVVDGYHFGADYQRALKGAGLKVLFIDDNGHAGDYCADIVLNQNIHADESIYAKRAPGTRLLLGTKYVLLRKEFWPWREWKREIPDVARKVLVTMGGADPDNATLKVVKALGRVQVDGIEAVVVAGASNPHYDILVEAATASPVEVRVERNVTDMPALMAWADVAVSAAGTTVYELARMGLPAILVSVAENQRPLAEGLEAVKAATYLGECGRVSPAGILASLGALLEATDRRRAVSARCAQLVDSRGARRVITSMLQARVSLRRATEHDARLLWEWANDPNVRRWAFHPDAIPWEEHARWFSMKLSDANCLIFIGMGPGQKPVGQVRLDISDGSADVDVSVAEGERGRGYGSAMIDLGVSDLFSQSDARMASAVVIDGNLASLRAFETAGFSRTGEDVRAGQRCVRFVRGR